MKKRWVTQSGKTFKQVKQSAAEVQAVVDLNHHLSTSSGRVGGAGSEHFRFVANIPTTAWAQWSHDWRMKGGLEGTGMKCQEYVLLRSSTPDYSDFVATPSGKTGLEKQARRLQFGYDGKGNRTRPQLRKAGPKQGIGLIVGS